MATTDTHDRKRSNTNTSTSSIKKRKVSLSDDDSRRRSNQACDRCRLKKVKCDGAIPCQRCSQADSVCQFGVQTSREGKSVSAGHVNQLQAHNEILSTALRELWERHNNPPHARHAHRRRAPAIHTICQEMGSIDGQIAMAPQGFGLDTYHQEGDPTSDSDHSISYPSPTPSSFDQAASGGSSDASMAHGSPPPSLDMPPPLTADNSPNTSYSSHSSGYLPTPQSMFSGKGPGADEGHGTFDQQQLDDKPTNYMAQQDFGTAFIDYAPNMKPMYGPGSGPGRTPLQYDPQYGFGTNPFERHQQQQSKPLEFDDVMDVGDTTSYDMPDWSFTLPN